MKSLKACYQRHPYLTFILGVVLWNIIGMLIAWVSDGGIVRSNIYTVLFVNIFWIFSFYRSKKKDK